MAQNDQAVFVIDFCVLRNAFPIKTKLALDPVMIALNQNIMKELGGTMPQEDRNGNME